MEYNIPNIVNKESEFWDIFDENEQQMSELFVEKCFEFIDKNPGFLDKPQDYKEILVVAIFIREIDDYGEILISPEDIIDVLEENLETQEKYENYELCLKIKSTLESLKNE